MDERHGPTMRLQLRKVPDQLTIVKPCTSVEHPLFAAVHVGIRICALSVNAPATVHLVNSLALHSAAARLRRCAPALSSSGEAGAAQLIASSCPSTRARMSKDLSALLVVLAAAPRIYTPIPGSTMTPTRTRNSMASPGEAAHSVTCLKLSPENFGSQTTVKTSRFLCGASAGLSPRA